MNILKMIFGGGQAISIDDLKAKFDNDETPFVIDVRQVHEYQAAHLKGTQLIPLNQLKQHFDDLPQDREIICFCRTGSRSSLAARQLNAAGYEAVNVRGGILAWQRAGYPVKKGKK